MVKNSFIILLLTICSALEATPPTPKKVNAAPNHFSGTKNLLALASALKACVDCEDEAAFRFDGQTYTQEFKQGSKFRFDGKTYVIDCYVQNDKLLPQIELSRPIEFYHGIPTKYEKLLLLINLDALKISSTQKIFTLQNRLVVPAWYVRLYEINDQLYSKYGSKFWALYGLYKQYKRIAGVELKEAKEYPDEIFDHQEYLDQEISDEAFQLLVTTLGG